MITSLTLYLKTEIASIFNEGGVVVGVYLEQRKQVIILFRFLARFHDFKLRTKFLISFAAVILVTVLLVGAVIYQVSIKVIKDNTSVYSQFLNEQIGINLEKRTHDIETNAFERFRTSRLNVAAEPGSQFYEEETLLRSSYIKNFVAGLLLSQDDFQSVLFFDPDNRVYIEDRLLGMKTQEWLPNDFNVKEIENRRGRASWIPGGGGLIFMAKSLYSVESSTYAGTVVIGIDSGLIRSIYTNIDKLIQGDVLILNEQGLPIVQNDQMDNTSQYFIKNAMYEGGPGSPTFRFEGKNYIYTILTMPYSKWRIVQIIPVNELTSGTAVIRSWTVTVLIASLLFAFLTAIILSKRITENVRLLMKSMSQLSVDFTHKVIVPKSKDEVGLLAEKFNSMTEKINELIHTVYKEQMMKQQAEYRTLQFEYKAFQAQINPHFLYNTLETIHGLARLKGEEQIGQMVYLLGSLLRESIGKKGDIIPLEDEVDFISKYLEIHRIMYEDKIEIKYDFGPDVMTCFVPKFILQPLVENSIQHGIEMKPGKGRISIEARRTEQVLELTVADNGVGMSMETINAVVQGETGELTPKAKHTSIGMSSVHKRIRILYGNEYGIAVSSELGEGTTVHIRLPIIQQGGTS
jgi:two-component system sensor histidine kinase YesM